MLLDGGFFGLAVFALTVYCLFDCIRTTDNDIQNLPKLVWLVLIFFLPLIGPVAWLLLGRSSRISLRLSRPSEHQPSHPSLPAGPPVPPVNHEDHQARREEALRRHHEKLEAELRQREEEVRRLQDEIRKRENGTDEPTS